MAIPARQIPGPKGSPLLGIAPQFSRNEVPFIENAHRIYGDVVRLPMIQGLGDWYLIRDPALVHEITVTRWDEFDKPQLAKTMWKPFIGNGLVPEDGDHWKRQHRMVLPGFRKQRIDAYGATMVEYVADMLSGWKQGEQRDMEREFIGLTLSIVGKTLFDVDIRHGEDTKVVADAMIVVNRSLAEYGRLPIPLPRWFPTPGNRRKVKAIQDIEDIVMRIVAERRAEGVDRGDLLSTVVFARDANGEPMTDREVRDEAMTIFFAGHETTAHAMTWAWYLLSKHPRVAEKLYEEVDRVCGDRLPTVNDLPSMPYSEMVFKEALRLIPAVWAFMRSPNRDLELGGYAFPKGANLFISPYMLGRDARWWKNPERFEPERFENDAERHLPKGAFVPFAAGPRVCLGKNFAMMEARLVITTLIQRLRPQLVPGFEPNRIAELSLHPGEEGLQTIVQLRPPSSRPRRSSGERLSDAPPAAE